MLYNRKIIQFHNAKFRKINKFNFDHNLNEIHNVHSIIIIEVKYILLCLKIWATSESSNFFNTRTYLTLTNSD